MAGERQQIGEKVVVRISRAAVKNDEWSAAPERLVIDHDPVGVDESLLDQVDVGRGLGCLGVQGGDEKQSSKDGFHGVGHGSASDCRLQKSDCGSEEIVVTNFGVNLKTQSSRRKAAENAEKG
jgi:hypothetical protein